MSRTVWGMSRTVGENVSDSVGVCLGQCEGISRTVWGYVSDSVGVILNFTVGLLYSWLL